MSFSSSITSVGSGVAPRRCSRFRSKRYWLSANATHGQCLLAMSRSFWKRGRGGSTLRHENSLQHLASVLRSMLPQSGAGPPSSKYTRSRSVRREPKEKEGHDFEAALSLFFPVGLIAERAGLPFALSSSISPPPPTADARVSARSKPDGGGDVSGGGPRTRPRAFGDAIAVFAHERARPPCPRPSRPWRSTRPRRPSACAVCRTGRRAGRPPPQRSGLRGPVLPHTLL